MERRNKTNNIVAQINFRLVIWASLSFEYFECFFDISASPLFFVEITS